MKLPSTKRKTRDYQQTTRAESAQATGDRIVEAFLARLMTQWFDEITLDLVADDAGVTVQTVIRRFGGKDDLLGASLQSLGRQINARRAAPPGDVALAVQHLMDDYEETGDPVLRLLALEARHPSLKSFLDYGRAEHRRWVGETFADRLTGVGDAVRAQTIDALIAAADVYTWKLFRRDMGHGKAHTGVLIQKMILGILAGS